MASMSGLSRIYLKQKYPGKCSVQCGSLTPSLNLLLLTLVCFLDQRDSKVLRHNTTHVIITTQQTVIRKTHATWWNLLYPCHEASEPYLAGQQDFPALGQSVRLYYDPLPYPYYYSYKPEYYQSQYSPIPHEPSSQFHM